RRSISNVCSHHPIGSRTKPILWLSVRTGSLLLNYLRYIIVFRKYLFSFLCGVLEEKSEVSRSYHSFRRITHNNGLDCNYHSFFITLHHIVAMMSALNRLNKLMTSTFSIKTTNFI